MCILLYRLATKSTYKNEVLKDLSDKNAEAVLRCSHFQGVDDLLAGAQCKLYLRNDSLLIDVTSGVNREFEVKYSQIKDIQTSPKSPLYSTENTTYNSDVSLVLHHYLSIQLEDNSVYTFFFELSAPDIYNYACRRYHLDFFTRFLAKITS